MKKIKIKLLMISSSSNLGGGTKNMFDLGQNLNNDFKVFYALPKNINFQNCLNSHNHIQISERKLNIIDIFRLINFVKYNSIDIIHAHGKGAGLIARLVIIFHRIPLIYTFHGIHLKCHSFFSRLTYICYEYILGRFDSEKVLVSKSEKIYAQESNIYLGKKYQVICNGVNDMKIKDFQTNNYVNINNLKTKSIKVISICRFVYQKNIEEILQIAQKIPDLNFLIIGNGPLFIKIRNIISEKTIKNVFLLGEKKNIFKYLYSSDIYLSTSLYEGLPISILEAMSIGLPIVASRVMGNCDTIVNGESGFLYELKDIDNAVYFLNKLLKSKNLRMQFGKAGFIRQRKIFSRETMINKYIDLYKKFFKY